MPPSSNWLALKKNLSSGSSRPGKRRKVDEGTSGEPSSVVVHPELKTLSGSTYTSENRDSSDSLRQMVYGQKYYPSAHSITGKYVAIDCEMVGIAGDPSKKNTTTRDKGDESSLARVSVVNYYGAVQLDVFVRQRERVTDWRTAVSGVRESDMVNAKSFSEVQILVADLLKDRILVGHAVHNDLKALLLSHPHNLTRDTQALAGRHGTLSTSKHVTSDPDLAMVKVTVNKKPALRKLVMQEFGIDIQAGEHSSVTDARATMAIYRLHRKTWDKDFIGIARTTERKLSMSFDHVQREEMLQTAAQHQSQRQKRSREDQSLRSSDDVEDNSTREVVETHKKRQNTPSKQKGISSGLSVIVKRRRSSIEVRHIVNETRGDGKNTARRDKWWGTLGN